MDTRLMQNKSTITWNQFLQYCKEQATDFECFDQLIQNLQTTIRRLPSAETNLMERFQHLQENATAPYDTDVCIDEPSCKVMLILLQPEAEIGLHNHPKQSGVLFCFKGEVLIEAFDEKTATPSTAILQKVYSKTIRDGESASLTPTNANIHSLKTQNLTMLIDIFIPPPKEEHKQLCRSYTIQKHITDTDQYEALIL
jgi:hypothetical protein